MILAFYKPEIKEHSLWLHIDLSYGENQKKDRPGNIPRKIISSAVDQKSIWIYGFVFEIITTDSFHAGHPSFSQLHALQ